MRGDRRTDRHYQVHYLPALLSYAVNNKPPPSQENFFFCWERPSIVEPPVCARWAYIYCILSVCTHHLSSLQPT